MLEDKFYKRGLFLIFGVGIILRLVLYLQNPSLWGDEAALAINVCNKSYKELFGGLDILQASPVGFTIIVKFLLNLFNPISDYWRDMLLRAVPFISGMLVLPVFYYLVKMIFKDNKKAILTALFFFILNHCAVVYTAQFKQYSTELLVSVILLVVFYKILVQEKYKWKYALVLAVTPWFSYSSFFVLASGFLCLLIKKRKECFKLAVPLIISCIIYYYASLKSVFAVNFSCMVSCWRDCYGFMDFHHPLRFLFKYGELFAVGKLFSGIAGFVFFAVCFKYLFSQDGYIKKSMLLLPLLFTVIASLMHKYAIQGRLILFLLPMFSIIMASLSHLYLKSAMLLIICISIFVYSPMEISYSYSRPLISYLKNNIKEDDIILLDHGYGFNEYDFYLGNDFQNKKLYFTKNICTKRYINDCKEAVASLPAGNYYFLSSGYYVKEITDGLCVKELNVGFKPKRTKAIYFEKRD